MIVVRKNIGAILRVTAIALLGGVGLWFVSGFNYLLYHGIVELFCAVVAFSLFTVFVSCRRFLKEGFFLVIGVGYLFVGVFDLLHMLAYKGMGVFDLDELNASTQLWVSARFIEMTALIAAPLMLQQKARLRLFSALYGTLSAALLLKIFVFKTFPACFVEGVGLTPFKVVSEYLFCLGFAVSIALFVQRRALLEKPVVMMVIASIGATILSELSFTLYDDVYGFFNFLGHVFKIISFMLIYFALVKRGITQPVDLLFRRLTDNSAFLKASKDRFQSLFDHMLNGFAYHEIVTDDDGKPVDYIFLEMNPVFEEMTGISATEAVGKRVTEVLPTIATSKFDWFATFGEVALEGTYKTFEQSITWTPEGTEQWHRISVYSPELGRFAVVLEDLTEQRIDEEKRRQIEAKVQYAQKLESLRVLAGGVAHDFNNLLTGVLANADLARMDSPNVVVDEYLDQIQSAAKQAADLSHQMLAYSGGGKFEVTSVSLSNVIEQMADLMQVSIYRAVRLEINTAPDVPYVRADITQIRQVIMNLISNASEAIGDNRGTIAVKTGLYYLSEEDTLKTNLPEELSPGPYVYMDIRDTGCGMDNETVQKIFDPFFTTKFTGRGLGLASTLGIIKGHQGSLRIESKIGVGTTIRVYLPAAEAKSDTLSDHVMPSFYWQGGGCVLLAEDDETVRMVTKGLLERMGFDVILAKDGREGLELFTENAGQIDLVLLDLTMPHLSGEEVLIRVREIRQDVPVLLASGYSEMSLTYNIEDDPRTAFSQKPHGLETLTRKISKLMQPVEVPEPRISDTAAHYF